MADSMKPCEEYIAEIEGLRDRLEEAEETLRAIRSGEVDALVVAGPLGHKVYTLTGEERAYRLLVESINDGALTLTPDGITVYANRAISEMLGMPLERIIGSHASDLVCEEHRPALSVLLERAARSTSRGELCLRKSPIGDLMWAALSLSPLMVDEFTGISMVVTDLTERKAHEEELRIYQEHLEDLVRARTEELQSANEELEAVNEELTAGNEEMQSTTDQLIREVEDRKRAEEALSLARAEAERRTAELESFVSSMSDGVVLFDTEPKVLLINEATKEFLNPPPDVPYEVWTESYELRNLNGEPVPIDDYPSFRALRGEATKDVWYRMVTPWRESLVGISGSPVMDAHGRVIGGSLAFRDISIQVEFQQCQQELLEREHHIAEVLQKALIPDITYEVPGCVIAVRYEPALQEAEVGGDFYDVFDMGDNKYGLLLGDVAGKGLAAAIQVAAARHSFRSYAYIDPRPDKVMTLANNALCRDPHAGITMLTAFFAVVDLELGVVTYANGGHETPVLRRADGTVEELLVEGRALGVMEGHDYADHGVRLNPGDLITMVTDGIIEARPDTSHLFGIEGMKSFLSKKEWQSADELAEGLLAAAKKHAGGALKDDAAILVFGLQKEKKI